MGHILGDLFGVHGTYISKPPSFQELKRSIDNDHPLIATLQSPMGSGHVVVVSGYEYPDQVIVLDPINGKHMVDYQTLISNFTYGFWTGSFLITQQRGADNGRFSQQPLPPGGRFGQQPPPGGRFGQQPAIECLSSGGPCPMRIPIPIGTPCTCTTPYGLWPGISR
jgi:hypothetical protein